MTDTLHSCGYHCQIPFCIKAQRDKLIAKYVAHPGDSERFAIICDGVAEEHGGVAAGPFVTDFGKHTQQSMAAGAMNCASAIRNIVQPFNSSTAGWKPVPIDPTQKMLVNAWREASGKCDHETLSRIYKTMLAVSPLTEA